MLPCFKDLYQQLIATPSISSTEPAWDQSNEAVIDLLATWSESLGCKITKNAIPGQTGKFNLIAQLGSGDGGLMLSGHSDTVPFDEGLWQSDPFTLDERNDRWYGLGSIDMKGFFAFALEVIRHLDTAKLKNPLYLVATADEETSMAGARYLVEEANKSGVCTLRPEFAIIGEPTNLQPIIAHKGHLSYGIRIQGKSGHSSQPHLGLNAIDIMQVVLSKIIALREHLAQKYKNALFDVPYPTLNLGHIEGGDSPNRICGHCCLGFDIRPTPDLALGDLRSLLDKLVEEVNQRWPNALELICYHDPIPPYQTSQSTELVHTLEQLGGQGCHSVNYCTEAPYIQALGCETVIFGPGSIEQAHQPNEYLDVRSIKPSQQAIKQLIQRYCY